MQTPNQENRYFGQIKFFNRDRGFGFITRLDDKKDFFVHYQDIKPTVQCRSILFQNEYVEFSTRDGPNGEQASDVTGLYGGTLMCETQFGRNKHRHKNHDKQDTECADNTTPMEETQETA